MITVNWDYELTHSRSTDIYIHLVWSVFYLITIKLKIMKNTSKILIALGAGAAIGGLLGILFAPATGADTRKKISEGGKKLAEKFNSQLKAGKQKFQKEPGHINGEVEEA